MNDTLVSLLSDATGIDASEITPELSREEDDRWDSLSHLRLITALEQTFSIRLSMDEIEEIQTGADLEKLVNERAA